MAYILDATTIRRPTSITEENSTQYAQHRTLNGSMRRDYFGDNKRQWILEYENTNPTDYTTIRTIYDSYLSTNDPKSWQSTETNYTIAEVDVHIDLKVRDFGIKGESYISSFTLILTEV